MAQLDMLSPETEPGKDAGSVCVKVPGWKVPMLNPYFSNGTGCHVNSLGSVDYPLGMLMPPL